MLKTKQKINFKIVNSVNDIDINHWNIVKTNNVFLDLNYLSSIEKTVAEIDQFYYVIYYNDVNKPIGKSIFQKLQYDTSTFNFDSIPCNKTSKLLQLFLKQKISILIAGNIFATGNNIYSFNNNVETNQIFNTIDHVVNHLFTKDITLNYAIFKEFSPKNKTIIPILNKQHYLKFNIDVNMVLNLKSQWNSFKDIKQDFKTKYRSRFNKVLANSSTITVKSLDVSKINDYSNKFQNLYKQVLKNSNFNLGVFNIETFIELKEKLQEKYSVFGYFIDDKLICFRSAFRKNGNLETSFIGIDYSLNLKYNLYQRMLIDFINYGFEQNANAIGFGRTAETMKSAFGALPQNMNLFIRSRNRMGKYLLRMIVNNINPTEFKLRQPFKKEFYTKIDVTKHVVQSSSVKDVVKSNYCLLK